MLANVPLFSSFTREELTALDGIAKEVDHVADDMVVQEGATGVGFHLILEGQVKVTVGGKTVSRLGPGDFFGEIALLDGGPRTATVSAETPLRTLSMASWEFKPFVERHPSLAYKLLVEVARRLRSAERAVPSLTESATRRTLDQAVD